MFPVKRVLTSVLVATVAVACSDTTTVTDVDHRTLQPPSFTTGTALQCGVIDFGDDLNLHAIPISTVTSVGDLVLDFNISVPVFDPNKCSGLTVLFNTDIDPWTGQDDLRNIKDPDTNESLGNMLLATRFAPYDQGENLLSCVPLAEDGSDLNVKIVADDGGDFYVDEFWTVDVETPLNEFVRLRLGDGTVFGTSLGGLTEGFVDKVGLSTDPALTNSMTFEQRGSATLDNIRVCREQPGGEGCTPGYWRNHLEDWPPTGFSPGDDFDSTFGVDLFDPNITLEQAINLGGGGVKKLARHGTAGLLSAAHPDVAYPYSVAQVIAFVQAGNVDPLAEANELGCEIP